MFPCLRHHALAGIDNEENEVNAGQPGNHILYELFMPRYVDDTDAAPMGQIQIGKP